MHDPQSVAFEIKSPFIANKRRKDGTLVPKTNQYQNPIITIWHVDPETDGTDDSCGWFIRLRHANKDVYENIAREFESEWDTTFTSESEKGHTYNCGWFTPEGDALLSVQGIVFNMYLYAAKIALAKETTSPGKAWDIAWRFMNKHHCRIMYMAENNRDSLRDAIVRKFERGTNTPYTKQARQEMIRSIAGIVYTDILRMNRKWYQHPRWHVNHWRIQFHPWQKFKRRYIDKCGICGKRGFDGPAFSTWTGKTIWCEKCENESQKRVQDPHADPSGK